MNEHRVNEYMIKQAKTKNKKKNVSCICLASLHQRKYQLLKKKTKAILQKALN